MNHITLALVAVLAAALVIGTFASPAFAGGHEKRDKYDKKGDSSATITKQINKQLQVIKGKHSEGTQDASNCIAVANGASMSETEIACELQISS